MATPEVEEVTKKIEGVVGASYFPPNIISNSEFATFLNQFRKPDEQITAEGIFETTGIKFRHLLDPIDQIPTPKEAEQKRETVIIEMARRVAKKAIEQRDWRVEDIDCLIFTTSIPYGKSPARRLKEGLGLRAFNPLVDGDILAECASFNWALDQILKNQERYLNKKILFVASEYFTPLLQPFDLDRTLFSDGACALTFVVGVDFEILSSATCDFPEFRSLVRAPIQKELMDQSTTIKFIETDPVDNPAGFGELDGKGIFRWALDENTLPPLIYQAISAAKLTPEDIKIVVPHQANGRIIEAIKKSILPKIGFGDVVVFNHIKNFGNSASVTIPNALLEVTQDGLAKSGDKILILGFGAGMSAGATVIRILN